MGFFSDLKNDLSQAVNELMPSEKPKTVSEEDTVSLGEMPKNIDSIQIPMEKKESEDELKGIEEEVTGMDSVDALEGTLPKEDGLEGQTPDRDPEKMLQSALTEDRVQVTEKTEEYKGAEKAMELNANRSVSDETSVITAGMSVTGDIVSEGSLELIGKVMGNIEVLGKLNITGHINGNSKAAEIYAEGAKINGEIISEGAVKIGASTVIVGNITATSAAIAGAVKGDIDVRGPVVLDASAIVMGNIKSKSVQINNGAVIEGMCSQCYADVSPTSFFEDYKMEMKKDKSK